MKKLNKTLSILFAAVFALSPIVAAGCNNAATTSGAALNNCSIERDPEFGGVYIHKTIEAFNELGFEYGDSVKITFSNGYVLNDIPYYNGYYTQNGEPLLVAYPGYPYIKAAINNGEDLWEQAGLLSAGQSSLWAVAELDGEKTATITLNEHGKYLATQNARDLRYEDQREKYPSDVVFANFRAMNVGNLKENLIYRSASPCDNKRGRASYVDGLIQKAGIGYIINLADTSAKIDNGDAEHPAGYIHNDDFDSPYFLSLYQAGKVLPLALNMNFASDYFKTQTLSALRGIKDNDGPFLIHCTEGKDRTGFLCMLVEALAGATYGEIVEDYMMTYFNYYAITKARDPEKYAIIVEQLLNPMIVNVVGEDVELNNDTILEEYATQYVMQGTNGLSSAEVATLKNVICE